MSQDQTEIKYDVITSLNPETQIKYRKLKEFFSNNPKVAISFSGGVDSAFLLYAAKESGIDVKAYYVKSAFQPEFELKDSLRLIEELDASMEVLEVDVLSSKVITSNPPDRCYHCKRKIFEAITNKALMDGYNILLDGTNASDEEGDRPGMRALKELSVLSPLRECNLTKDEIRLISKEAGLFTWNKAAYACLATRIPVGEELTMDKLKATEEAEDYLFSLGFTNFRIRRFGECARIQITENQIPKLLDNREPILKELKKHYSGVMLDFEVRK
ncbi:MAG: ATP-dependent sacrificial sulfur transferase LarE [Candidatus Ornithospirochaeta sp.]